MRTGELHELMVAEMINRPNEKASGWMSRRAVLAATALACAGCASSGKTPKSGVEKPDLTVATVKAVTNMGLYLAKQHGFFADEGLHVKIAPVVSSTDAIASQLRGGLDITAGEYAFYILAQARHPRSISLRIIAAGSVSQPHSQEVLVKAGSSIKSVPGLRGKTVATDILRSVGTLLIDSMLNSYSLSPSSVKQVAMPFPAMAPALQQGEIDAGWFDEPYLSEAHSTIGAETLYDTSNGATASLPISGYMVTRAWAERYPRTAAAFARAIARGQALAGTSRAAGESAITSFLGVDRPLASVMTFDTYPTNLDSVPIQRVADVMHQFGLLSKPFDVKTMID
jgi:NitT/TauT family transport system substrate-binding protein